jgi:hypothetical protein
MTLNHIFGNPDFIKGVGNIYPIRLKDNDEFSNYSGILLFSRKSLGIEETEFSLLKTLVLGTRDEEKAKEIIHSLMMVFNLALRKKMHFIWGKEEFEFVDDEEQTVINELNYEDVRSVIMKQNLIFEPKIFKDKRAQEWANKVLAVRAKSSKLTIEDMITTVCAYNGLDLNIISEYSKYQLQSIFYRINKIKSYDTKVSFACAGAKDTEIPDYTDQIEMFKSPYDDIFVSKNKLSHVDEAVK